MNIGANFNGRFQAFLFSPKRSFLVLLSYSQGYSGLCTRLPSIVLGAICADHDSISGALATAFAVTFLRSIPMLQKNDTRSSTDAKHPPRAVAFVTSRPHRRRRVHYLATADRKARIRRATAHKFGRKDGLLHGEKDWSDSEKTGQTVKWTGQTVKALVKQCAAVPEPLCLSPAGPLAPFMTVYALAHVQPQLPRSAPATAMVAMGWCVPSSSSGRGGRHGHRRAG